MAQAGDVIGQGFPQKAEDGDFHQVSVDQRRFPLGLDAVHVAALGREFNGSVHGGLLHFFPVGFADGRQVHVLEHEGAVQGVPAVNLRQHAAGEGAFPDGSLQFVHHHPLRGDEHFPLRPAQVQRSSQDFIADAARGGVKADAPLHQLQVVPHREHAAAGKRHGAREDEFPEHLRGVVREHAQRMGRIGLPFQAQNLHGVRDKTEVDAFGLQGTVRRTAGQSGGGKIVGVGDRQRHVGQDQLVRHQVGVRAGGFDFHPLVFGVGDGYDGLNIVGLFQIVKSQRSLEGEVDPGVAVEGEALHEEVIIFHCHQLVDRVQGNRGLSHHEHLPVQEAVGKEFKFPFFQFYAAVLHEELVGPVFHLQVRRFHGHLVPGQVFRLDACAHQGGFHGFSFRNVQPAVHAESRFFRNLQFLRHGNGFAAQGHENFRLQVRFHRKDKVRSQIAAVQFHPSVFTHQFQQRHVDGFADHFHVGRGGIKFYPLVRHVPDGGVHFQAVHADRAGPVHAHA